MTGFSSVKQLVDAEENGQYTLSSWRKLPTQVTTIGSWFDLSMSPGNPIPQYYASTPLVSVPMGYADLGGLYHGKNLVAKKKYLRQILAISSSGTPLPMPMIVADYLLYYPFIDEGTTDDQILVNTYSIPRYTSGVGVQMMAVGVAGRTGGQSFNVTYTNSDGVAGRTTATVRQNTVGVIGTILTADRALSGTASLSPFIPLQMGDIGVRSIQSVRMVSGTDVGLFTLVLVKPLAQMFIRGADAPVEVDYFVNFSQCPSFENDAFLNFLCCPAGSLSGVQLTGLIKTIWD